jgi:hypothetical protein
VFELTLRNVATFDLVILNAEFDLWQVSDLSKNRVRRLGELRLDPRTTTCDSDHQMRAYYKQGAESPLNLFWHASPDALQAVEDFREGKSPIFEIQSHFLLSTTTWLDPEGKPKMQELAWEGGWFGNTWPLTKVVADVEWLAVLDALKFKHHTLDRLKWPAMPPAFSRAELHLADAWRCHRTGDDDGCLSACQKAFECLGFDLYKDGPKKRIEVLALLMDGAEPRKIEVVDQLMDSLQGFFHLGRHAGETPIKLTHYDSQLAVACATTLMSYLAPNYKAKP